MVVRTIRHIRRPGLGMLACLCLLLVASSSSADPRFHGGRVYVASQGCGGQEYRPRSIVFACGDGGFFATNVRYRYYGGRTAFATAELHGHNCIPNCAESQFHAFPGTVRLADVVRCEGTLYYSRAYTRFAGHNPFGGPLSEVANIEPLQEECSTVLG